MMNSLLKKILYCFFISFLLSSCSQEHSVDLLKDAQYIAENKPEEALVILRTIDKPENMPEDYYMQYIVALVQTKFRSYEDITTDSLIFTAQRYFNDKNDYKHGTSANFYAGSVYYERQESDKALKCYLEAKDQALRSNNNLLTGKSYNNIGRLYFEQGLMRNAIPAYKQAASYYGEADKFIYRVQAIYTTGLAYYEEKNLDSAYYYYNKGLAISIGLNKETLITKFTQQLGIVYRDMGDYQKSSEYLHTALPHITNTADSLRLYLNIVRLFNVQHQTDSAKYYTDKVKNRLHEITYLPTLQSVYNALSEYNTQIGNYKQAKDYATLEWQTKDRINFLNSADKLLKAGNEFSLYKIESENKDWRNKFYIVLALLTIAILVIVYQARIKKKNHHIKSQAKQITEDRTSFENELENQKNIQLQKIENLQRIQKRNLENERQNRAKISVELRRQQAESSLFLLDIQRDIILDWKLIDKRLELETLNRKLTSMPEFYEEIEQLIANIKQKTNKQLFGWAKECVKALPHGQKLIVQFEDKELLLLVLCYTQLSEDEIAFILDMSPQNILILRAEMKQHMELLKMSENTIADLLYPNSRKTP